MSLRNSLFGQLVWVALAICYNTLSLLALSAGEQGFAGDTPTTQGAILSVMVFAAVTVAGLLGKTFVYRLLAPCVTIALFLGGVVKHLIAGPDDYASMALWRLAIAINVFGTTVFLLGVIAAFRQRANQ